MEIIPAIDIIDGKCVRLAGGDYGKKKVYNEDPLAVAREFEEYGIRRLHLVDLDGAKSGGIVNRKILETIASGTNLVIDFGGGIKRDSDIRAAFESGAAMVTGGSIAVKEPETFLAWHSEWGPDRIILGADARDGFIAVSGWLENSGSELIPFVLDYLAKGIRKVICTDISKDGMMSGASIELYKEMMQSADDAGLRNLELIASGGVTYMSELDNLAEAGLSGAIIGKAIYEGSISLKALGNWIENDDSISVVTE
ncbi:MAG: 1-(5-phosphoribosyl)-5-[(5-phosphoribosylamino)methylideneamino]imidazole-4-carboxamide isomerase [Spirochaetales bacterium]|nr:1-(5-phosphoribosyl)-5-[(5-phosphoribosylamino)methylideneamino]imidazole-4-carboxamide isomerase [Spirochaetales bacterium]